MNEIFDVIAARHGGVVMRAQARAAGYTAAEIDRRRRKREWVPIRRGAYVRRTVWEAMTPVQRHFAKINTVVQSLEAPAVVSHQSAVVVHGLPTWDLDLSLVHVTRGDLHSPRIEAGVHHHAGSLLDEDITDVGGIAKTAPARIVIDTARETPFEPSVVVADAMLHRGLVDKATMLDRLDRMRDWPGTCNSGRVVEFADGLAESVGESRSRVLFDAVGLPRPSCRRSSRSTGWRSRAPTSASRSTTPWASSTAGSSTADYSGRARTRATSSGGRSSAKTGYATSAPKYAG